MEPIGIRRKSLDQLLEQELEDRSREEQQVEVTYEIGDTSCEMGQSRLKAIRDGQASTAVSPPHAGLQDDNDGGNEEVVGSVQTEKQVTKNTIVLGVGVALAYSGFAALQSLQSSLFLETGLGLHSLSVIYGLATFSCLYGPIVVQRLSPNWTLIIAFIFEALYVFTFFYPRPYTLIPSAVFLGLSLGPMFCAQFTFLMQLVSKMAYLTHGIRDKVQQRYLRLFYAFFNSSRFWGNLVAALVVHYSGGAAVFSRNPAPVPNSRTTSTMQHPNFCAELQCQYSGTNALTSQDQTLSRSSLEDDYVSSFVIVVPSGLSELFVYVFSFCSAIGVLVVVLFLDRFQVFVHQDPMERSLFTQTLRQVRLVLVDPHMRLALPMLVYIGLEQGFIFADFTRSYVSCTLGLESVGYTMMSLGGMNTLGFLTVHQFSKHIKRPTIMAAGLVCNAGLLMVLWLWTPVRNDAAVFYVIAAGWGLCNAVWETLTITYVATTYADDWQVPFCAYYLMQWLGTAFSYSVSRYLCTEIKIYIVAASLLVAISPYTLLEFRFHHRNYIRERTAVL